MSAAAAIRRARRLAALVACALAACSHEVPASLLVTVINRPGRPGPDTVRVRIFDDRGLAEDFTSFPTPAPGPEGRLGTVVVYPREDTVEARARCACTPRA